MGDREGARRQLTALFVGHFIGQDMGGCPQEWRTEVKGTKTTIRPLDWHCASPFGHDPPWPSPYSTSACVASSALLCRVGEASRTKTLRSWCSDIRFVFSNANSTGACGIDQQIGRSSRHSAACSQGHVGDPSW